MSTGNQAWDDSVLAMRKSIMELEQAFRDNFSGADAQTVCEAISDFHLIKGDISAAYEWCVKTFGPPGERWFYTFHKFYFSREKDYILFELRW